MSRRTLSLVLALGLSPFAAACDDDGVDLERMIHQFRYEPYESSRFFTDGKIMRDPPRGTIHRDQVIGPPELVTGLEEGGYLSYIPIQVDRALLTRGENRYRIFCATCHGELGNGVSQVAENMRLRPPPSLHEPRLRNYPAGRLYRVIEQGYGLMPNYQEELAIRDRWAVVAFVQALQLSQNIELAALSPELRKEAESWLR